MASEFVTQFCNAGGLTSSRVPAVGHGEQAMRTIGNLPAWLILALLIIAVTWAVIDGVGVHPWNDAQARDAAIAEGVKASRTEMAKSCWNQSRGGADADIEAAKSCLARAVK